MKRLLLLLACLLALCTGVCAAEPVISEMKTDCTLTGSGSCQVTQSFTLEISGAQTQLRFPLSPRPAVALVVLLYHPQGKLRIVILDMAWQNDAFATILVGIYG